MLQINMSDRRLKVLIIAHEFSPFQGSECAVGWNIVTRLAKHHDVIVLYASGSQQNPGSYVEAVNNFLAKNGPINGLSLVNVDQPGIAKFITSINRSFKSLGSMGLPFLYYWGYKYWQKAAFKKAKTIHKKEKFDVVHQLTQIAIREPGYCWKLGIPFFWGPTGGLKSLPKQYYKILTKKSRVLEEIRKFSNFYQFNYSYRVKQSNKRASVIYTYSTEDADVLRRRATGVVKIMLDVGTSNHENKSNSANTNSAYIKGIWCGQLIERKAATILLRALALSKSKEGTKFQIIGSGPLQDRLHKEEKSLGINNIEWIKNVDHDTVFRLMGEADFLVHTSLREATSSVIPEALSMGLPVICHDANGMSIAINESCGIKIPLLNPEASIHGFSNAIDKLVFDKQLLKDLKKGARKRSIELSWDMMAATIANDYSEAANNKIGKSTISS